MVKEVLLWSLAPKIITSNSWYASIANFKFLRNQELSFLFGIEKNPVISTQLGYYEQVGQASIPLQGLYTHLKEFHFVKDFRQSIKTAT
jgi:hypothetical protein